eukprot:scaffold34_cov260-Pinguiococcus_pyrenoidosus.AAC.47
MLRRARGSAEQTASAKEAKRIAEKPTVAEQEDGEVAWELPGTESAYFYGAPSEEPVFPSRASGPKWSAVAKDPAFDDDNDDDEEEEEEDVGGAAEAKEPLVEDQTPVCIYFTQGFCRYGDQCRYRHPPREEELSQSFLADEAEGSLEDDFDALEEKIATAEAHCGICLDPVQGVPKDDAGEGSDQNDSEYRPWNRFGIMPSCNHTFCLSCIREWRSAGAENATSCPLCREVSHYVIPSNSYVVNPEKKKRLVADYLAKLRSIDCKHFDMGRGECPFGVSCFYRHRYPDGTLASRDVRLLQGAAGAAGGDAVTTRVDQRMSLADWIG